MHRPLLLLINSEIEPLDRMMETLEAHGFDTIPCRSAEEAMDELLIEEKIACLLCELYLPGIDGWRLCRLLKGHNKERLREIPIILYSHLLSGQAVRELSYASGARSYLTVPTEPENLVQEVRHALEGSRSFHRDKVEVLTRKRNHLAPLTSQLDPLRFYSQGLLPEESTGEAQLTLVCPDISLHELQALPTWSAEGKGDDLWIAVRESAPPEELMSYVDAGFDAVIRPDQLAGLAGLIEQCKMQRSVLRVQELEQEKQERATRTQLNRGRLVNLFLGD